FCFAPSLHPAMRHVGPVRRQLGVPTIFNLLGPLCNPARAPYQVMGVGMGELRHRLALVLARLGTQHAVVVTGDDGLGEITLATTTRVCEVRDGKVSDAIWSPRDFGLEAAPIESLVVEDAQQSAARIQAILAGERGAPRDIVILNAAAALWTAGAGETLKDCATAAAAALDSGAARDLLSRLARMTQATA